MRYPVCLEAMEQGQHQALSAKNLSLAKYLGAAISYFSLPAYICKGCKKLFAHCSVSNAKETQYLIPNPQKPDR